MPYLCDVCNKQVYKVDLDQVGLFFVCPRHSKKLREYRETLKQKLVNNIGEDQVEQMQVTHQHNFSPNESFSERIKKANLDEELLKNALERIK